jgi:AmiR/NasT family two-component response regulator
MRTPRIVIASEKPAVNMSLKNFLLHNEFEVVALSASGNEALRKTRILKPDFLIINHHMPDIPGYTVAKILTEEKICTVLVLSTPLQKEQLEKTTYDGDLYNDIVTIEKPVNKSLLINTLNLLIRTKQKIEMLESEVMNLRETIEAKKYIEKAKGILMKNSKISEPDAYRRLQKKSMDSGIPMKDIAKLIIETME